MLGLAPMSDCCLWLPQDELSWLGSQHLARCSVLTVRLRSRLNAWQLRNAKLHAAVEKLPKYDIMNIMGDLDAKLSWKHFARECGWDSDLGITIVKKLLSMDNYTQFQRCSLKVTFCCWRGDVNVKVGSDDTLVGHAMVRYDIGDRNSNGGRFTTTTSYDSLRQHTVRTQILSWGQLDFDWRTSK